MPHVRDWIRAHGPQWLEKLVEAYKIDAIHDGDLVSLKYNQIESPMHEPIVQECRGMVVHVPTSTIMAHPYNKFWNMSESLAAPIDWSTARVQDKLDGSLMTLYWHWVDQCWSVASSGHPTAGGSYGSSTKTFADAFWEIFHATGMRLPEGKVHCYMFELCSPDNRIVCKYDKPQLIVHGGRRLSTEEELPREILVGVAQDLNWTPVLEWPINTAEACQEIVQTLNPVEREGFIVVDAKFNRVKVKSPRYVALHHLKGNGAATDRRVIDLWKAGEVDELLAHFPELKVDVEPVLNAIADVVEAATDCFWKVKSLPSRKAIALAIRDLPYASVIFKLLDGHTGPSVGRHAAEDIIRAMPTQSIERMLAACR